MTDNERNSLIEKLERYKSSLESREDDLLEELSNYKKNESIQENHGLYEVEDETVDIKYDIYNKPYETYLLAQIKIVKELPSILEDHLVCLKSGKDLDLVLESLYFTIYKIKKEVYNSIEDWDTLLKHLSDERLSEIQDNPKGPGDLIIKELCWIRDYERSLK